MKDDLKTSLRPNCSGESQRDSVSKSRVGAQRLPWEYDHRGFQPQRGCGLLLRNGRKPFGVESHFARLPRVARASQPWALSRNPVGILHRVARTFLAVLLIVAATLAHAQAIALVPEKAPPAIADRQEFQIPDRVQLSGWVGSRIHANDANRMAKIDADRLLEGYRKRPGRQTWDGEHVGKWLHAATLAWANSGNPELRKKLDYVVTELMKCQLEDGYLGTYVEAERWTFWDVWAHKYNLIGLITYMRYTGNMEPISTCRRMADLLRNTFGEAPGQRDILLAGRHIGMAPTSVLEPMLLLYRLTGEPRYLDFSKYILRSWEKPTGPKIISTLLNQKRVDLVGNNKAYEMLSCVNGALEYHRTVGEPEILEAAINAWQDIVDKRLYITGTASYREFFHADFDLPNVNHVGETCVTVTWIQFNAQLLRLTGEARFAEQLERATLNQLFAAQSPDGTGWGYYVEMQGKKPYTSVLDGQCCLSSGPRGVSLIPTYAVSTDADGIVVNLYDRGTAKLVLPERSRDNSNTPKQSTSQRPEGRAPGVPVEMTIDTRYPSDERIRITVTPAEARTFAVKLRIPEWCAKPMLQVNGKAVEANAGTDGYAALRREWRKGDKIDLRLKLEPRVIAGDFKNEGKIAVLYGPLVLASDDALLGGKGQTLSSIGVPGPDLAALRVTPKPAPAELRTWPGAQVFHMNAVARDSECGIHAASDEAKSSRKTSSAQKESTLKRPEGRAPAQFQIGLLPFADAGASGSSYKIWLPYGQVRPSRNLLLDGIELRSRRPHLRDRREDQAFAVRFGGSVVDEFQTIAMTFDRRRAQEDWYAVELEEPVLVAEVVFFHGRTAQDGGWFDASDGKPRIEIKSKPDGDWEPLCELKDYPKTTASNAAGIKGGDRFTCELDKPVQVFGVRIIGKPASGDNPKQNWSSCLELQAFGPRKLNY